MATTRIACKLPNGITIDHQVEGKTFKMALKGANDPQAVAGYGVTTVDADVYADWFKTHGATFAPVKQHLIFELPAKDGEGKVKERAKDKTVRSGAEPIDPKKPARGVEPTEEQQKELDKLPEEPDGQTVSTS